MSWLLWVALALLVAFVVFWFVRLCLGRRLLKQVSKDSLIIFGKKGKGKTLLFSEMTRDCRRTGYLSTTDFKHKGQELVEVRDISLEPNTWEKVLNGQFTKVERKPWERKPVFIDDAGIYLPNFADGDLKKRYPSLPLAYAVWRHLYDAPIHVNSQAVDRVYKLLREQADGFIQVRGCVRFLGFAVIRCTYYDRIASAREELAPMPSRLFNKFSKAEVDNFRALHGDIRDFYIFAPTWRNKYDDRYFRRRFFGEPTALDRRAKLNLARKIRDRWKKTRSKGRNPEAH